MSTDTIQTSREVLESSDSVYNPGDYETEDEEPEDEFESDDEDELDEFSEELEEDSVDLDEDDQHCIAEIIIRIMEINLRHYTEIPRESAYILDLMIERMSITKRDLFLVLRKICHNESFQILGDLFGISRQHAGRIFYTEIDKIASHLKSFIYWPEPSYIPLQFKQHKFKHVQSIIECLEISIGKPRSPVDQALTYSFYKNSSTLFQPHRTTQRKSKEVQIYSSYKNSHRKSYRKATPSVPK